MGRATLLTSGPLDPDPISPLCCVLLAVVAVVISRIHVAQHFPSVFRITASNPGDQERTRASSQSQFPGQSPDHPRDRPAPWTEHAGSAGRYIRA